MVMGDKTLHPELSPIPHTHTCTLTDLKRQLLSPAILKILDTNSLSNVAYHLVSQSPSLGFHPLAQAA